MDVQACDVMDLSMVDGIGKKLGVRIKTGADELEIIETGAALMEADAEDVPVEKEAEQADEEPAKIEEETQDEVVEETTPSTGEIHATEDSVEEHSKEEQDDDEHEYDEDAIPKVDAATVLLQWQLDGYDVATVEKMIFEEEAKQDEILEQFQSNIEKLKVLKEDISRREFPENMDEDVERLLAMLNDPMRLNDIENAIKKMDGMKSVKIFEAELDGIEGNEEEKEAIRELARQNDMDEANKRLHRLKQRQKEDFFATEFSKIMDESSETVVKTKKVMVDRCPAVEKFREPMVVDAVFLTNKEGKPMSFRTRKPRSEVGMKWLKGAATSVRAKVLQSKGEPGEVLLGNFEGHSVIVHKGELSYIGVLYRGQEHPLGRRMLKTALGVMEAKHYHDLKEWDGKSGVTSVGKSMNAIIPAFIKLNKLARK